MATNENPKKLTIRMYNVGFGDCFLLAFDYPARGSKAAYKRHVLVDFGSYPEREAGILDEVAAEIEKDCDKKLDAIVVTHRHADHINGFATNKGDGPGDIIARCQPDVIIQPWTEDPDAKTDAKSATKEGNANLDKRFVAALGDMERIAAFALSESRRLDGVPLAKSGLNRRKLKELGFLGETNIANASAVKNLIKMGSGKGKQRVYVHYGSESGLEEVLPGVTTRVLGPPTLEQSEAIRKERRTDPNEFWQLQAMAARGRKGRTSLASPFDARYVARNASLPYTRWFVPKLKRVRGDQLLEIVRQLDKQMNNTSVILLFEVGGKKLLFPGDAQIENWSYALKEAADSADVRQLLRNVTLYKVGHHGSRNATPKSLWTGFNRRGPDSKPKRLISLLSTESGHHGKAAEKTEVPRRTLVAELAANSNLYNTQKADGNLKMKIEMTF